MRNGKNRSIAMTNESFVHFFKSGGVKGQSPLAGFLRAAALKRKFCPLFQKWWG